MRHLLFVAILVPLCLGTGAAANAVTVDLQPGPAEGKDAQIGSEDVSHLNFGSDRRLTINWSGNLRSIGLIEFDLSAFAPGAVVTSATLSLFHDINPNLNSRYDVFRVTSSWDEASVTFDTAPSYDPFAAASLIIPDSGTGVFRSWDVSSLVQGWISGTYSNFGMWIEEIPVQGSGSVYFSSSDADAIKRPILSITTADVAPVPVPAALPLFGAGLGLLGVLGWRKRRKAKAI